MANCHLSISNKSNAISCQFRDGVFMQLQQFASVYILVFLGKFTGLTHFPNALAYTTPVDTFSDKSACIVDALVGLV